MIMVVTLLPTAFGRVEAVQLVCCLYEQTVRLGVTAVQNTLSMGWYTQPVGVDDGLIN